MLPSPCTLDLVLPSVPTERGAWVHYRWHKHHKEHCYGEYDRHDQKGHERRSKYGEACRGEGEGRCYTGSGQGQGCSGAERGESERANGPGCGEDQGGLKGSSTLHGAAYPLHGWLTYGVCVPP